MLKTISLIVFLLFLTNVTSQPVYPVLFKDLFLRDRPIPSKVPEIKDAFVWEDCKHLGNNTPVAMQDLVIHNDYGLMIWWNRAMHNDHYSDGKNINESHAATDDFQGIFDCTITVKLGPHDPRIAFQEMIFGFLKDIDMTQSPFFPNVSETVKKLDPENTLANKGLKELQFACKNADNFCRHVGCVIIEYGDKVIPTCKNEYSNNNMGDKLKFYTRDNIRIRILAVGVFIGKDKTGYNLPVSYPPMNIKFRLEFTRVYGGPCYTKQQYFCPTLGICIRYALACDPRSMWNCPKYDFGRGYDEPDNCNADTANNVPNPLNLPDLKALNNLYIFWILLGIFSSLLAYLLLNYCLWRPGYLIWRCGRIRNWCAFGNCCYQACHNCSQSCNTPCCKTQGTFDTTETSTVIWSKFPTGDGFHMRENR